MFLHVGGSSDGRSETKFTFPSAIGSLSLKTQRQTMATLPPPPLLLTLLRTLTTWMAQARLPHHSSSNILLETNDNLIPHHLERRTCGRLCYKFRGCIRIVCSVLDHAQTRTPHLHAGFTSLLKDYRNGSVHTV